MKVAFPIFLYRGGIVMIKAVIFDMDGVIIDSEPLHYKIFMNYTKTKFGFTISDEEYDTFIGTTNLHMFSKLKEKYKIESDINTLLQEYEDKCVEFLMSEKDEKPISGVDILVKKLYEKNIKLALASSSPKKQIHIVLDMFSLSDYFAKKVSGQEVEKGKPAPDIFLRAAELLGVLPEECLVFEDSRNGVLAAKTAGMKCIAFYNPNSGKQDLSYADKIIKSFDEVNNDVSFVKEF